MCHSCWSTCQQRVLKVFPGPGYLHFEEHSLTMAFLGKFAYIYIYIERERERKIDI